MSRNLMGKSAYFFACVLAAAASIGSALAGNKDGSSGTRGGGDGRAIEFVKYGKALARDIAKNQGQIPEVSAGAFASGIEAFNVGTVSGPVVDSMGKERDVVTDVDPGSKLISISRERWDALDAKPFNKASLVFHEYLRAAGYGAQDGSYALTDKFMGILKARWPRTSVAAVEAAYTQIAKLGKVLRGRLIRCVSGPKNDSLTVSVAPDKMGMSRITVQNATGAGKFVDEYITQISVGEYIFVVYKDKNRSLLQLETPSERKYCTMGFLSYQPSVKDLPVSDTAVCCLH